MRETSNPLVMRLAWWIYLPMLACAGFVQPAGRFGAGAPGRLGGALLAAAAFVVAAVLFTRWSIHHTGWGRRFHAEFYQALGPLSARQVGTLALLSGTGEEVLFRGVLQPLLGLWVTSVVFAAIHFPRRRALWVWPVSALIFGLFVGWLTLWSGTLWPAVGTHIAVNAVNLRALLQPPRQIPPVVP